MTNTMSAELNELREKVNHLSASIRAEKRAKTAQGIACPNIMCKDWMTYSAERARLHSMERELGLR